ncbi:MAG: ankyrin repeat domain-containing protein [Nanoarchaeota archaeon]
MNKSVYDKLDEQIYKRRKIEVVEIDMDHGITMSAYRCESEISDLIYFCRHDDVESLIEKINEIKDFDVNKSLEISYGSKKYTTLLKTAFDSCSEKIIKYLATKIDINISFGYSSLFHDLCLNGTSRGVSILLKFEYIDIIKDFNGDDISKKNKWNEFIFVKLCQERKHELILYLCRNEQKTLDLLNINKNPDINKYVEKYINTSASETVRILGVDDVGIRLGLIALCFESLPNLTIDNCFRDFIKLVIHAFYYLNYTSYFNDNALYFWSIENMNTAIVGLYFNIIKLFSYKIVQNIINEKTSDGKTMLCSLCLDSKKSHRKILHTMLKIELIDINTQDGDGNTCVHYAVGNRHITMLKKLQRCEKINMELVNNIGESPLHIACKKGYLDMVQQLLPNTKIEKKIEEKKKREDEEEVGKEIDVKYIIVKNLEI